jgi:hypothetical protein
MRKTQVFLKEDQLAKLKQAAKRTGRTQSALIREGVDLAIKAVEPREPADWKKGWEAAFGVWKDRDDLEALDAERRRRSRERMDRLFPE